MKNSSNKQNVYSYYILNHRIRYSLSHCYFSLFFRIWILLYEGHRTALSVRHIDRIIRSTRKTKTTPTKRSRFALWLKKKVCLALKFVSPKFKPWHGKKSKFGSFSAAFLLLFIFALFFSLIQRRILHVLVTLLSKITGLWNNESQYLRCKMLMHVSYIKEKEAEDV